MFALVKILHLLSLGLWSGAIVFFSFFVALPTIEAMRRFAQTGGNWLHLATETEGTQLAGLFLDSVFGHYFLFQIGCGVVALATGLRWLGRPGWIPKGRVLLIAAALVLAGCNQWVFGVRVHELREQRYSSDAEVARRANEAFGPAHSLSLTSDMTGLLCVLVALALAAWLPAKAPRERAA